MIVKRFLSFVHSSTNLSIAANGNCCSRIGVASPDMPHKILIRQYSEESAADRLRAVLWQTTTSTLKYSSTLICHQWQPSSLISHVNDSGRIWSVTSTWRLRQWSKQMMKIHRMGQFLTDSQLSTVPTSWEIKNAMSNSNVGTVNLVITAIQ